jgi:flagellar protein FliS
MVESPQAARYREIEIRTATPTELVVLMYDSAISALQQTRDFMRSGNIAGRARCLNKASSILTELQATLNFEAGGEIARSLDRLYAYMRNTLFEATTRQDVSRIDEVVALMTNLRSAWIEVAKKEADQHKEPVQPSAPSTGAFPGSSATPGATQAAGLSLTA